MMFCLCQIKPTHCGALKQDTYWICDCSSGAAQRPKVQEWGFVGQCVNVFDGFNLTGGRGELNHHGMSVVVIQSKSATTQTHNMSTISETETMCGAWQGCNQKELGFSHCTARPVGACWQLDIKVMSFGFHMWHHEHVYLLFTSLFPPVTLK